MASSEGQTELLTGWSCVVHQPSEDPEPSELPSTVDITAFSAGLNIEPSTNTQNEDCSESGSESESGSNNSGSDGTGSCSVSDSSDSDSSSSSSSTRSSSPEFSVTSQPNGLRLKIATVRKSCGSPAVEKTQTQKSDVKVAAAPAAPPPPPEKLATKVCNLSSTSDSVDSESESETNESAEKSDSSEAKPIIKQVKDAPKKGVKTRGRPPEKKAVEKRSQKKGTTSPKNSRKSRSKRKKLLQLKEDSKQCNDDLWEAINLLTNVNRQFSESLLNTQLELKEAVDEMSLNNINSQYVHLQESYHNLKSDYNELTVKYEKLCNSHKAELEDQRKQHNDELEIIQLEYSAKCSEHEDVVGKLKDVIDLKKEEYLKDLHTSQAESASRFDEMESNLQKLLDASNQKIRELNRSNSVLRSEMMTLKSNFSGANSTKIQELGSRLLSTENQLRIAQSKLLEHRHSFVQKHFSSEQKQVNNIRNQVMATHIPHTYTTSSLQNVQINNSNLETVTSDGALNNNRIKNSYNPLPVNIIGNEVGDSMSANIYKETKKTCWYRNRGYNNVPTLKQVGSTVTSSVQIKRRKLHTPNEHLEHPD